MKKTEFDQAVHEWFAKWADDQQMFAFKSLIDAGLTIDKLLTEHEGVLNTLCLNAGMGLIDFPIDMDYVTDSGEPNLMAALLYWYQQATEWPYRDALCGIDINEPGYRSAIEAYTDSVLNGPRHITSVCVARAASERLNGSLYRIDQAILTHDMVQAGLALDGSQITSLDVIHHTEDNLILACKTAPAIIKDIDKAKLSSRVIDTAIKHKPTVLLDLDEQYITPTRVALALDHAPGILLRFDSKYQTPERVKKAIIVEPWLISEVLESHVSKDIVLTAAKINPLVLCVVDLKFLDQTVLDEVVSTSPEIADEDWFKDVKSSLANARRNDIDISPEL